MAAAAAFPEEELRRSSEDHARRKLTEDLGKLYGALLRTGRTQEAAAVAGSLLAALDTPDSRMALVRQGLALAKYDPIFTLWLDEAEAAGGKVESLRRKLAKLQPHEDG
jgi:hypothetical protein